MEKYVQTMIEQEPIRVMVVDDSSFMRQLISDILNSHERIEVVASASDGMIALQKIKQFKPDVVTLDVEMPKMGGIDTLQALNEQCPTPVIMLSSFTQKGAEITVKALELGAIDFLQKPSVSVQTLDVENLKADLVKKVMLAANLQRHTTNLKYATRTSTAFSHQPEKLKTTKARILVIGSSTGGPKALQQVIPSIPADFPLPVLIVQHMPPRFTTSLAERLNSSSKINVKEAEHGDPLEPGLALLAPGNFHMEVDTYGAIRLTQDPIHCGVRPAIDKTLFSVVKYYGGSVLSVILTGMGHDGLEGVRLIKRLKGRCIAEDESTCVVYGMPKSIVEEDLADSIVPIQQVAERILSTLSQWQY